MLFNIIIDNKTKDFYKILNIFILNIGKKMSHKKVINLAIKFAQKTIAFDRTQEKIIQQEKFYTFFEQFKKHFRTILNEMDGDYMTLRVKGINRTILKEFSHLYHELLELFKKFDDQHPKESTQHIVNYVFSKSNRNTINFLDTSIQQFLKRNEIDFIPTSGLSQARVDSLKDLITLVTSTHNSLNTISPIINQDKLINEKEEYQTPTSGRSDITIG